jgi:hypothetical protein
MLTDEQLTERLRTALARHTADLDPPAGLLEAVHAEAARERPRRRWTPVLAGALGLALAAAVAIGVVVLAGRGAHRAPAPATRTAAPGTTTARTPTAPGVAMTLEPINAAGERRVTITVVAPRPTATGSWYAWSFTAPPACGQASAGGPTRGPVRAGMRLSFQALLPSGCRGIAKASVVYVTAASRSDSERFTPVGRTSVTVP